MYMNTSQIIFCHKFIFNIRILVAGNDTEQVMKNTARHIFKRNRVNLSENAQRAVEAQVLAFAKEEVRNFEILVS